MLWLPWAALVWAFIMASLALALGERGGKMHGTAAGARRGPRRGQFAAMRNPDGVEGSFYCRIDLRAPRSKLVEILELLSR